MGDLERYLGVLGPLPTGMWVSFLGGAWQLLGQYLLRLVIPRGDFSETLGPLGW